MKHWKTLEQKIAFDAAPYLQVVRQKVELDDGVQIDDFYQVHLRPFAVVVPQLADGRIVTIRQYKHGAGRVSLTFPAGFVEAGEAPEQAGARELLEETGYTPGPLSHMGEFVDNGNQRGCIGNYYVARDCTWQRDADSGDLEQMQIELLTVAQIDEALAAGEFAIIHHASAWAMARARGLLADGG